MNKRFFAFALGISVSLTTHASDNDIAFDFGLYLWRTQFSGTFTTIDYQLEDGNIVTVLQPTDVQDDLNMEKENQYSIYLTLEHSNTALPNLRFAHTALQADSNSNPTKDILFNGILFENLNGEIESEVDLTHTDLSGYYKILDNSVAIDLGLTVRQFDGFAEMRQPDAGSAYATRIVIDEIVPLIYGKFFIKTPVSGLNLDASLHFISYSGDEVIDFNTAINYQSNSGLGSSLGYRSITADLEDLEGQSVDLKADGPYAAITYHF